MKYFKLFGYVYNKEVLITDSRNLSIAASFDETLNLSENGQATFTCKIFKKLTTIDSNLYYDLFYPGARLKIQTFHYDGELDQSLLLIITSCKPSFYKENQILLIEANDYASIVFSKRGANLDGTWTGNIKELTEALLYESGINNYYGPTIYNYFNTSNLIETEGCSISYDSVITAASTNFHFTIYDTWNKTDNDDNNIEYSLYLYFTNTTNGSMTITIGNITKTITPNTPTYIDFELLSSSNSCTINFTNSSQGTISISNLKINQKYAAPQSEPNNPKIYWKTNDNMLMEESGDSWIYHFINEEDEELTNNFKRATLELGGSTYYNGLIEIGNLFDGELVIDYDSKTINFVEKQNRTFKGYRIDPNLNLTSINRTADTTDLITIMDVYGGEVNDTYINMIPTIPSKLEDYIVAQIGTDFKGNNIDAEVIVNTIVITDDEIEVENTSLILDKGLLTNTTLALGSMSDISVYTNNQFKDTVYNDIVKTKVLTNNETVELKKVLTLLDLVPNVESRIYDMDYFKNNIRPEKYSEFEDFIYNVLRKINLEIAVFSKKEIEVLNKMNEIYSKLDIIISSAVIPKEKHVLEAWRLYKKYLQNKEDPDVEDNRSKAMLISTQDCYNSFITSLNEAVLLSGSTQSIENPINIITDFSYIEFSDINMNYSIDFSNVSKWIANILLYYGSTVENSSVVLNGLNIYINSIQNKIKEYEEQYSSNLERINYIEELLPDSADGTLEYYNYNTELAGLKSNNSSILDFIGINDPEKATPFTMWEDYTYDWRYYGKLQILLKILQAIQNKVQADWPYAIDKRIGLNQYINDINDPYNLIYKKKKLLTDWGNELEPYWWEGYYENTDEIDSYSLSEQAWIVWNKIHYPNVQYDISVIDLSSLENYQQLKIKVGDLIKIQNDEMNLIYNPQYSGHLTITGINYTLRQPESTKLIVDQQSYNDKLIQKLFINLTKNN